MSLGMRVIRGRDWLSNEADGGEGRLGTVVSYWEDDTAEVIWDNGNQTVSSIGKDNKYELRIVDNAPVGIRHQHVTCDSCGEVGIIGMRWTCDKCTDFDLCSTCYVTEKHDLSHEFFRRDTPKSERVRVAARDSSKTIPLRGLLPGAVVRRGTHWEHGDKYGDKDQQGSVTAVVHFDSTSYRSAVSVAWDSGKTTTCRVGHMGHVDVQCNPEGRGPYVFFEHLPLLDATSARAPVDIPLAEGGSQQREKADKIKKGSRVRILADKDTVTALQKGHGEWNHLMEKALGKLGKVVKVFPTGDLKVKIGSHSWTYNPACCVPEPGSSLPYGSSDSDSDSDDSSDVLKTLMKALKKQTDVLELLGGKKKLVEDVTSSKMEGSDEFLQAVKDSDVEKLKKVLDKFPKLVTARPGNGVTCLHIAANRGKLEIVKYLVDVGLDKNAKDHAGDTPLLEALRGEHVDVARFLIEAGTDLDVINDSGQSTLHLAVKAGDATLVRDLIMRGGDVNAGDSSGDTPLHDAVARSESSPKCAEMIMMSPKIDMTITNERGFNPLHWATFHNTFGGTLVEKTILRNKSLIDVKKEDGYTALHVAAINNHTEAAQVLIKHGASTNITDEKNITPLHLACNEGYFDVGKMLVDAGADVNMLDVDMDTPLHLLLLGKSGELKTKSDEEGVLGDLLTKIIKKHSGGTQSRIKLATYLLDHGADINAKNKADKTPLDICSNKTLKKAVENYRKESNSVPTPVSDFLCCQCFENIADITILPCNHKMTCRDCHKKVSTCPLCGGEIAKAVDRDGIEIV